MSQGRILVADDGKAIRDLFRRVLTKEGYEVERAVDGEEAVKKVKEDSFDLVITDLNMPGMDGKEILRRVKQFDPSVEVIVITGSASVETALEALKEGAYDYISKPVNMDELKIIVKKCIEKKLGGS